MNIDSGDLLAMKQMEFQHNDHKTIKAIADEIKIFEGINHPNLVRYYGVEVHRVSIISCRILFVLLIDTSEILDESSRIFCYTLL